MKISFYKNHCEKEDLEAVNQVLTRKSDWANGPEIVEFESDLADITKRKKTTVFNSGTSALHAALLVLGVGPGDKVLVPSFTFISVASMVRLVGAEPVFVDIELDTFGIDPKLLQVAIITHKPKAVIAPHYAGLVCKIEEIQKICNNEKVLLIEDACEALGASISGDKAGSFGRISILSFAANKIISTGEGGACVYNNEDFQVKLEKIRSHGRSQDSDYFRTGEGRYHGIGYNWRMSSMAAALGISQLKRIQKILFERKFIAAYYNEHLTYENIIKKINYEFGNVCQFFSIQIDDRYRTALKNYLNKEGIDCAIYFQPINRYPSYKDYKDLSLPKTYTASDTMLSLPCYPGMLQEDLDFIIKTVNSFLV